ncbi:MAG: YfiR family protein [Bacteroidales bacterium]|nr:YfiR family protein [Bacteroidales bacterium]
MMGKKDVFIKNGLLITLTVVLFLNNISAIGQQRQVTAPRYISYAMYNFAKSVNWPEQYKSGDFILTVVGDKDVYNELNKLVTNQKIGLQSIVINYYKNIDELSGFQHILFLASWQSANINTLLEKVSESSTLIVTEKEGMIHKGSVINFIPKDGKMAFELSQANADKSNLQVSSYLKKMAILVN